MTVESNYIVIFDPLNEHFNPLAVRDALKAHPQVTHWWNHIINTFLVTFSGRSDELSNTLQEHMKGVRFFVMQVDPRNSEGYLPERSWSWITKRERELADQTQQPAE